jgi:uncharacterized glyoxalase superfamily protein PhnB
MEPFNSVVPILKVKNVGAAVEYYVTKLGFRKNWGEQGFASVSRGAATIFLCQGGQGNFGTWISIFLKDVDALHEEYMRTGALIVEPPMNFPWEHREMLVTDLDGNRLRMTGDPTGPPDEGWMTTERSQAS